MLQINNDLTLSMLKEQFHKMFPYLKIEFFKQRHKNYEGSPKKDLLCQDYALNQLRKKNEPFVLNGSLLVSDLEDQFQNLFGLSTQVFRRSGKAWIETSVTDDWSLDKQNEAGKELSELIN